MSVVPITGIVNRAWIPLIVLVVLAVSGLVVTRLHRQFASQNLNANAGAGIEIVQFNPKIMIYDVESGRGASKSCGTTKFGISWNLRARPRGAPPLSMSPRLRSGCPFASARRCRTESVGAVSDDAKKI